MPHFDAIVIGSGQAGPSLTARLTSAGMSVGFIEREHFGGTCVNDGCTPTQGAGCERACGAPRRRLRRPRSTAHRGRHEGGEGAQGCHIRALPHRGRELAARVRGCTIFWGQGRFTGPKEVSVNGQTLTADKIFINVGARPSVPPIPGLDQVPYLTNTSMMAVDFLPAHLVILGGSYVGLEFAQMYRRFGSAVTLIEAQPRLIAREDEDVSAEVARILEREEIALRLGAKALSVAPA